LAVSILSGRPLLAQQPTPAGTIEATVSTQSTIPLPGVLIELRDQSGRVVASRIADGQGQARFEGVAPGAYRLIGSLDGFQTTDVAATVAAGTTVLSIIDLPIAVVGERVDVVASPIVAETIGTTDAISSSTIDQFGGVDGLQAALKLLASVITLPGGGASIKGGRPGQASTQLGSGILVDPATGFVRFTFPADAIDSVAVLPNPYAVEYGRFSSGIVVIRTRKAELDKWKTRVGGIAPTLHTERYHPFHVTGFESFEPWVETGGPLVSDRLFIEQSLQFRYETVDVPSRPENERIVTNWLSTFTRMDMNLGAGQSLTGTIGYFPSQRENATLGTFTPPEAAADIWSRASNGSVTQRAVWSDSVVSESTLQLQMFSTDVSPHGPAPMQLYPETTLGDFYNSQRRDTATVQFIQSVSGTHRMWGSLHSLKGGFDLLHTDYSGVSVSRPVFIYTSDGVLVRHIDFTGPTDQSAGSTDVAVFVQDRVQLTPRWTVEFGGRLDRDGITGHANVTPRVGSSIALDSTGDTLLRGGYGLFYERTPMIAGAFDQFDREIDTRYEPDGETPIGPPVTYTPKAALGTSAPRSATWDLSFEHRFNKTWAIRSSMMERRGANELLVRPVVTEGIGTFVLDSSGTSLYRDAEIGVQFNSAPADFSLTYVRSIARGDLNTLTNFYDSVMWPVIGANAYAAANADVPHRLFGRGRFQPTDRWLITGVADWRTGFPYSAVNASLDFVGPRNALRFPNHFKTDLGVERHFTNMKWKPWIGVRMYNALDSFIPTDVQANLSSPAFGSFYNSEVQLIRLQIRFER
jgi:hypothetical protein